MLPPMYTGGKIIEPLVRRLVITHITQIEYTRDYDHHQAKKENSTSIFTSFLLIKSE